LTSKELLAKKPKEKFLRRQVGIQIKANREVNGLFTKLLQFHILLEHFLSLKVVAWNIKPDYKLLM